MHQKNYSYNCLLIPLVNITFVQYYSVNKYKVDVIDRMRYRTKTSNVWLLSMEFKMLRRLIGPASNGIAGGVY